MRSLSRRTGFQSEAVIASGTRSCGLSRLYQFIIAQMRRRRVLIVQSARPLSVEFPNAHVAPYFKRIPLGCQMRVRARQMLAVIDPARLHDMSELGIAG